MSLFKTSSRKSSLITSVIGAVLWMTPAYAVSLDQFNKGAAQALKDSSSMDRKCSGRNCMMWVKSHGVTFLFFEDAETGAISKRFYCVKKCEQVQ